jgi:Leucine-rich repeat (LRR) protein
LAGNKISHFAANCKVDSLIHLGMSNNLICDTELPKICQNFPNLFSIDLSYNQVCSLEAVVNNLKELG